MSSVLHVYIDSSCVFLLQDPLRDWKQTENSLSHWPKFAKSLIGKSKTNEKKCQGYVKYRVVESPKLTIFNTSELINDNYSPGSSNYYFSPKVVLQYFRWRVSISFQKLLLDLLLRTQMEENLYKRYKKPLYENQGCSQSRPIRQVVKKGFLFFSSSQKWWWKWLRINPFCFRFPFHVSYLYWFCCYSEPANK